MKPLFWENKTFILGKWRFHFSRMTVSSYRFAGMKKDFHRKKNFFRQMLSETSPCLLIFHKLALDKNRVILCILENYSYLCLTN